MGTRSTIALEHADGSVEQIYCHWDGYLDHNGMILRQHYQDRAKVQQLMEQGDMSSLGKEIGEKHNFDDRSDDCTFYGRDRGESGVEAKLFTDFEDYKANHQYEEYEYIMRNDGQWYVSKYSNEYQLLEDAIADELIASEMEEDE